MTIETHDTSSYEFPNIPDERDRNTMSKNRLAGIARILKIKEQYRKDHGLPLIRSKE